MTGPAIKPAQMQAARKLLAWSRDRLAGRLAVIFEHIRSFEQSGYLSAKLDLQQARAIFEAAGVEFVVEKGGAGVRLREASK